MPNPIVHWELMGPDGAGQQAFYREIFDWDGQAVPGFGDYYMVEGVGVSGAVGQGSEQMPSYVALYVQVDSIDDHLAKIEGAGGSTVMPRPVIPGTVTFAMFHDPAGNLVGLVEAETPE